MKGIKCFVLLVLSVWCGFVACEGKPQCTKNTDCDTSHQACKEGKCVHDHGDHDGGHHHSDGHKHGDKDDHHGEHGHGDKGHHHGDKGHHHGDAGHHGDKGHHQGDHGHGDKDHHHGDKDHHHGDKSGGSDDGHNHTVNEFGKCDRENTCQHGLICVAFGQNTGAGVCYKAIKSCAPQACESKYLCLSLSNGSGACALKCDAATACPNSLRCQKIESINAEICVP